MEQAKHERQKSLKAWFAESKKKCAVDGCDKFVRYKCCKHCQSHATQSQRDAVNDYVKGKNLTIEEKCTFCGETRNVFKKHLKVNKGLKKQGCARKQKEACYLRFKAKNSEGVRCGNPRMKFETREHSRYYYCGGDRKCLSGIDFANNSISLQIITNSLGRSTHTQNDTSKSCMCPI